MTKKRCCENCGNLRCANSFVAFWWDECVKSNFEKHWMPKREEKQTLDFDKVYQQEFHKQNQRNETIRKRNIPKTTICVHCGKDFVVTRGNQKFCSEDCKEKANEIRKSLKKSGTQKPTPTSKQDDVDPWEALANAIVIQAINDYRQSKDVLKYEPYNDIEKGKVKHIEKFIQSEYFKAITNLNQDVLLKKLRSE